jgi:hypothetical protein
VELTKKSNTLAYYVMGFITTAKVFMAQTLWTFPQNVKPVPIFEDLT